MYKKMWLYLLAGWLISMVISPTAVLGMFKSKKA